MKLLPFRPRVLLGIGAGIVPGFGAACLLRNYMLAAVLDALAAIAIGGLDDVKACTIVALVTGAGTGLVWAAMAGPLSLRQDRLIGRWARSPRWLPP